MEREAQARDVEAAQRNSAVRRYRPHAGGAEGAGGLVQPGNPSYLGSGTTEEEGVGLELGLHSYCWSCYLKLGRNEELPWLLPNSQPSPWLNQLAKEPGKRSFPGSVPCDCEQNRTRHRDLRHIP